MFKDQIKAFNEMYGLPVNQKPTIVYPVTRFMDDLKDRLENLYVMLHDEVDEVLDIQNAIEELKDKSPEEKEVELLTMLADWLGDLQVYCASEMMKFGLDNDTVLTIIMQSNMSKLGADGKVIMKNGKVQKGPNYWKPEPLIKEYIKMERRKVDPTIQAISDYTENDYFHEH